MSKSEEKRLKSLTEKKAAYKQQKNAVKLALSSIDSVRNNKIVFDDDDNNVSISSKKNVRSLTKNASDDIEKKQLFSDDEENEEYNSTESFKIKNQFEGEKGQKLLELQSRFTHDERFVLDSRFVDNEYDGGQDSTNGDIDPKEMEKDHQLKILDSILGTTNSERTRNFTNKPKITHKPIVRFDPLKEDHLQFEIKKETNEENVKRKKKKTKIPEKSEDTNDIINAPVVSKETFYKVTDSLKQALQEKESFSLLQAFGTSDVELKEEPEEPVETIRAKTLNHGRNPFKYDSSDSEDEEIKVSEKPQKSNNIGLWKENFFFKADDHRLKEGLEFISKIQDEEKSEQFSQIRRELKHIARTKLRNNQRNIRPFQKKLGGRKFSGNAKFSRNKRKR